MEHRTGARYRLCVPRRNVEPAVCYRLCVAVLNHLNHLRFGIARTSDEPGEITHPLSFRTMGSSDFDDARRTPGAACQHLPSRLHTSAVAAPPGARKVRWRLLRYARSSWNHVSATGECETRRGSLRARPGIPSNASSMASGASLPPEMIHAASERKPASVDCASFEIFHDLADLNTWLKSQAIQLEPIIVGDIGWVCAIWHHQFGHGWRFSGAKSNSSLRRIGRQSGLTNNRPWGNALSRRRETASGQPPGQE